MQNEIDVALFENLRSMARDGASIAQIIRAAIRSLEPTGPHKTLLIQVMRMAFSLCLQEAAPIGGWSVDGTGELSDERLNDLVMPAIVQHRQTWDRQPATA